MNQEIQDQLEIAKAPFVTSMEALDKVPALVDAAEAAAEARGEKKGIEIGFEQGLKQAGQAGGSDKMYSDAELNAELDPLKTKIAELEAEKEQMQIKINEQVAVIEAQEPELVDLRAKLASADADKAAAVEAKRKEIMDDFVSTKVDDEAFEAKHGAALV